LTLAELKQRVPIERVVQLLNLTMRPHGEALRGPCPACKQGGERALVATTGKNLFYCFGAKVGGDAIALAAHIRGVKAAEAARFIAEGTGTAPVKDTGTSNSKIEATAPQNEKGPLKPLDYLLAEHEAVQALGISPETCQHFGAGYAPKGIMRGRLAIPIFTHDGGRLLGYCGRAVRGETPALILPKDFAYFTVLLNAHRVEAGDFVYVARDPLEMLQAHENGISNVVSFISAVTAEYLAVLSHWMDEKNVASFELL
jgi:CHC2 zinc finger